MSALETTDRIWRSLDPVETLERLDGDRPLVEAIAKLLLARLDGHLAGIAHGVEAGDGRSIAEAAHALLGPIRQFRAARAASLLEQLQDIGTSGCLAAAPVLLRLLVDEVGELRTELGWLIDPSIRFEAWPIELAGAA